MAEVAITPRDTLTLGAGRAAKPRLDVGFNAHGALIFGAILAGALFFVAYSLYVDITQSGTRATSWLPFVLLGVAWLVALGYFGYACYYQHRDTLKLVAIDSGMGCITPTFETAADTSDRPLSRPIFLYVNKASAARAETSAFAQFYVDPDNAHRVREVGYLPLPPATLSAWAGGSVP